MLALSEAGSDEPLFLGSDRSCRPDTSSFVVISDFMLGTAESLATRTVSRSSSCRTPAAVALMSFSALLLELGLTRLFSVVLFYHFAFLAISIALLGLGAGAVFAYLRRE